VLDKGAIVIKDACILFDLIDLEILSEFYKLDCVVITTPQVIYEITNEKQLAEINGYIEADKLKVDGTGDLSDIVTITDENPGLTLTDASVIEIALRKNAAVLSSDKSLRNISQKKGLQVMGVLWIIERLYNVGIIEKEVALTKLAIYPEINKRAPKQETDDLIGKIQNQ